MSEWPLHTLGDFIEVKHGYAFKSKYFVEEQTGLVVVTPGNFAIGGGFKNDKPKWYDSRGPLPPEYILAPGSLIVTMTDLSVNSDTLGYSAIVPNDGLTHLHNQRIGLIRVCIPEQLDANYLYYIMCSDYYRNQVIATASGTTVHHTSPSRIQQARFLLPPLPIQRRIAEILGALDDKIEVNRRINRTLEAMAGALYKHWFVDFGPFQDGEFVESGLGLIPEGWTIKPLPEAIEVNPKRTLSKDQVAPYLEMSNMPTSSARVLGWRDRAFKSGMRFVNGDALVARITPCLEHGKTAFVDFLAEGQVGWGSTEYIVLHSKPPLPPEYAYFLARSEDFRSYAIKHMTGTSGRQRVPVDCFSSYLIVVPSWESTKEFEQIARLVMATIKQLDTESHKLAATRDYLLPRLLSGEIPVEAGEEAVGT